MKKFILGILIGIIIALGALLFLREEKSDVPPARNTNLALNKIRQQKNYQDDVQEKLQKAVSNLFNAKEPNDILKSLDEILKYRPNDANVYALKAQILQKQGNLPAALEAINKAIAIDPKNPNYYQMRAEIEFNAGDYNNAEKDFTIAGQLSGKADNYYNRAIANLNLGNYQAANRDFKKAQDLYKKEGNAAASKQAGNISQILAKNMPKQPIQGKTNGTTTAKPTVKTPSNPAMNKKVLDQISNSLKHISESETLKDFKDYMPKKEDIMSSFSGLPTQMPKTEAPVVAKEDAVPSFEDTIKQQNIQAPKINKKDIIKDTPLESIAKARKMLANKDFAGAKSVLDSAINKFPDNDNLYYNRAMANYQNGDYKAAFADLNKALELNPKNYQAAISKGDLYNSLGQSEQAKKAYLDAAKLAQQAGNTKAAEDAKARYQLLEGKEITARTNQRLADAANAYYKGDYDRATSLFSQIYEENPSADNAFNLGLAYQGQGKTKEANQMFALAAEQKPQDLKAQMLVAQSAIQLGNFDMAQQYLEKAQNIDDGNPDTWALAAQIDSHNGDYAKAKNDLQNALQGYNQQLGEIEDAAERERIEKQIAEIKSYLEQLAQAGI